MARAETKVIFQRIENIVIVPLPDPIHDAFLSDLRQAILHYLHRHQISGLVLDISGVEVLDMHDFKNIRAVADGAKLMGATVVLAGMKPGVAAGLTMLDVDDSWVNPAQSVERAMELLK